jgi:ribosomal protein S27AE
MSDATPAGDGPITTQPEGNPDFGMPGDSPLADAPMPEAPDLAPDSTEPAAPDEDTSAPDEAAPPPGDDEPPANGASDEPPPLPGETAAEEPLPEPVAVEPATDEPAGAAAPAEALLDARPEPRRLSRGEREVVDRTRQRFAACGRCGYLIADLYLLLGEETVQTAAIAARDGWLRLEGGNDALRTLLINAFGVRLDVAYEAMDGACPECRRRFIFAVHEDGRARLKLRT